MSEDYGIFVDGVNLASDRIDVTDVDMADVSLAVQFGEGTVSCRHCGSDLTEYAGGDWQADSGWRAGSFCYDRWSEADTGEDDEPSDDVTRAQYGHEPADQDSPTAWANGAGVIVTADSIQLWASVFEPRGAFGFTVRRGQNDDGSPAVLIHHPYPGESEGYAPLERISDGTLRVTDRDTGMNLSPLARIRASVPSVIDIRTYADGFGRWHCEIDQRNGDHAAAGSAAWSALQGEIAERGRGDRLQGLTFDHADSRDGILTSYFIEGDRTAEGDVR